MDLSHFTRSLSHSVPPKPLAPTLEALWWAAKGDWDRAHELVQHRGERDAAWVHAYLHRVEGDIDNARYWYSEARQPMGTGALDIEWEQITQAILGRSH
ncbi:MAG TPA: hypothetical protein VHN11_06875 [Xanthobacteraceae bacterium]|jgi:hypothetical protein|nr:hypothetical protein [Xanthobacteraceae bacterium]